MAGLKTNFTKRLGIAATVVSLSGGSVALWKNLKPAEDTPDLSGRWTITNTVTSSKSRRFDGEVYIYSVGVTQDADKLLPSKGEQTHYNGKPAPGRWPFIIDGGKVSKDQVVVNFTIRGNREFSGTLRLQLSEADPALLHGNFTYTADGTTGTTEVRVQ